MEQKVLQKDVPPSEQAVTVEQRHQNTTRVRNAPTRFTINSCISLHCNDVSLIQNAVKESALAQ